MTTSGSTSPALSDGTDSPGRSPDRVRRGSGSYYNAVLAGNLNLSWELDELQSLSPLFTSSPSGSVAPISDRECLISAASHLESDADKCGVITDLLLTLTKMVRALCVFNVEYLKTKVAEAREVLEADDAKDVAKC